VRVLSKKTKYGINALVFLTRHRDQGPIAINRIAEAEHIPAKYLEAILLELKNAGILASRKGKGGGYYLLRPPEKVRLSEIMRLFDGPIALLPCVTSKYYERCEECRDEATCGIRSVFQEVRAATVRLLDEATLAAVLDREDLLQDAVRGAKRGAS
jgi:Rrf2 family protein